MKKTWIVAILMTMLGAMSALEVFAQTHDITWYTIDGGGAMASTAGGYELSGTIGQPDASAASAMTGATYSLTGGFWGVTLPLCSSFATPDFDHDCDVDSDDLEHLRSCTLGPGILQNNPACADARLDGDDDVDMDDFGILQRCYRGPNQPASPTCAN